MNARPYQSESHFSVLKEWQTVNSTLVVLPTGTGKTRVASLVIQSRLPGRTLFLCHRRELVWQATNHIKKVTGLDVGVEMGEYKVANDGFFQLPKVIVSTVQTLSSGGDGGGRLAKFLPTDFDTIIQDEAHHACSPSWRSVIKYFSQNESLKVLGVTATPDRADEEALGQIFESVAYDYEISDAVRDGWLVPIEQQMVSVAGLDYAGVRTTAGDLNNGDLARVMESEKNLHGIAYSTIDIVGQRRGIGFAASVEHARQLAEICNRHRTGMASYVHGGTDPIDRKQIINDFSAGKIQFLWNCGIFTEGFDDSGVEVISMARPTKSRSLYAQMAGRGTRPHETIAHRLGNFPVPALRRGLIAKSCKPSCLILDFVGNSGRHKLVTAANILGGKYSDDVVEAAKEFVRKAGRPVRMADALEEEEKRKEEAKKREIAEAARKAALAPKANYKTQNVDPFDVLQIRPVKERGWDVGKQLKDGSKKIIRQVYGMDPDAMTYSQGMQLVREFFNRKEKKECTFGQAKILKKYGYDVHMPFDQAKTTIDAIAANGWKRPAEPKPQPVAVDMSDDVPY